MAGLRNGPECKVCSSPHRASIEFEILSGGLSAPKIGDKYGGIHKDSVLRHKRNHMQDRANAIAAIAPYNDRSAPATALANAQQDMAATIATIAKRAESIMQECERQYERVKDSNNVKDISELLKLNLSALRELGNLAGAYPKQSAAPTVDARSVHLSGLTPDQLHILIDGLREFKG